MMNQTVVFAGISAKTGERKNGYAKVLDTEYTFPVTIINGHKPGKTVLLTAGIHGCEYTGIETAIQLAQELAPEKISGTVVIISPVNVEGFLLRRPYIIPTDGKNLNRLFPGNPNGTIGDKIAYFLTTEFQDKADFYLDIHGGDLPESLPPYIYHPGIGENEAALALAEEASHYMLSAKYSVKSSATTGAYNSCAIRGIPSLLLELGEKGTWTQKEVDAYKNDILNILRFLKVYEGEAVLPTQPAHCINRAVYLDADIAGCWYPLVEIEDEVKAGDKIGEIKDFFGNTLKEYFAEFDGIILFRTVSLAINQGDALITYGSPVKE